MPTFTANLSTPFRGGVTERFKQFLQDVARAENVKVSHRQTMAWFRFDSPLSLAELETAALPAGFQVDFFDTKHEEEMS